MMWLAENGYTSFYKSRLSACVDFLVLSSRCMTISKHVFYFKVLSHLLKCGVKQDCVPSQPCSFFSAVFSLYEKMLSLMEFSCARARMEDSSTLQDYV